MSDEPKLWIGTPGENDWRDVGEVQKFETNAEVPESDIRAIDPGEPVQPFNDKMTITTTLAGVDFDALNRIFGSITPAMEQLYRSVMVVGTRAIAHQHPGPWELRMHRGMPDYAATVYGATKRVEHARARKLYSERLRRDRRRRRTGRKPILRSGPSFRAMFPRVEVQGVQQHGDALGIRMITSSHLDAGQVAMFDTRLLDRFIEDKPMPLRLMYDDYDRTPRRTGYTPTHWIFDEPFKINPGDIS